MIQREEHDGTRRYYIEEEVIRMEGEKVEKSPFPVRTSTLWRT